MQQRESSIDGGAFYTNKKNKKKKEEKEEDNRHPVPASFSFTYNSYKQFPKKKED